MAWVLVMSGGSAYIRPTSELQPTSLPGTIPGKICSLVRGFTRGTVERPDDSYLRSGQAVWTVFTLALQDLRVEVTKPRILQ